MPNSTATATVPRLTYLRIKNYRALRDVEFRDLTPLTVLIGPNGSGKSTVLDALDFLAEAISWNLVQAWEVRNRITGIQTKGNAGDIEFEVGVTLLNTNLIYKISLNEKDGKVYVTEEVLRIRETGKRIFYKHQILQNSHQRFNAQYSTDFDLNYNVLLESNEVYLSYKNLFHSKYPELIEALVDYLRTYRLFHLTDDHLKGYSDAGPREKLSPNGDNLPNVLYYLHTKHPEVLEKITAQLRRWVPQLADVVPEITSDERLLLRFKDAAFEKPLPAQYISGGTMRLAALLTLLYEPGAAGLLGIEEPENELHPQLLPYLAEELIAASEQRQLLVVTHSPFLLDTLDPAQVWILHRDAEGYTQATRTADIPNVPEFVEDGSPLGYLWTSNSLPGNPLAPRPHAR